MACKGCTSCTTTDNGTPAGCGSKGNCATGGCNRLNTFDWLTNLELYDSDPFDIVEVSFKNGARKYFYRRPDHLRTTTGDMVVVETGNGHDIGQISLSGELVRLQMKKKKVREENVMHQVIRQANERDLERLDEARRMEHRTMVRSRAIARSLGLEMKIGDVEYQGDKRKATFYYTADGRVDFRELIRHYAREFRVKIEMRQIGARQESARIGGIGSCGRELCCSTWLTDFKSVSTSAARYQNLAINQAKLSGQCGRLKCCLNYELDTYLEALEAFPEGGEKIRTKAGTAVLIKTDIFKKIMYYVLEKERGKVYPLPVDKVTEILEQSRKGAPPIDLSMLRASIIFEHQDDEVDFADVTGEIELPEEKRRKKRKNKRRKNKRGSNRRPKGKQQDQRGDKRADGKGDGKSDNQGGQNRNRRSGKKRRNKRRRSGKPNRPQQSKNQNKDKKD